MSNLEFWDNFLNTIRNEINLISFNTWFTNINLLEMNDKNLTIQVPMPMHKIMLGETYYDTIDETIFNLTGNHYDINFLLEEEADKKEEIEVITTKEDCIDTNFDSNLLKKYTFDSFIVGDTNRFAKTAGLAVAEQPGKIYNPLFIYGKSGLGKTHLMHAIGNFIVDNSNKKVLYITSDDFMNEFTGIANIKDNSLDYANHFKDKYRNIDVLIIDDIQYLVGAEKTQQEFFNTFNSLHQANKQIIISSDRSPEDLKKLEERLRSRFTWGLPVDIYPPDLDLRIRILKNKISNLDIASKIEDDVISFIANTCDNDVRYLEGAITRLVAFAAMTGPTEINLAFAHEALKDYVTKNIYFDNDISSIQKVVADFYNIKVEDLKGKKRSAEIAYPRQVGMYLARMLTDESFPRIGLEFGGRDHSTVIYACDKITKDLQTDMKLKEAIDKMKAKL